MTLDRRTFMISAAAAASGLKSTVADAHRTTPQHEANDDSPVIVSIFEEAFSALEESEQKAEVHLSEFFKRLSESDIDGEGQLRSAVIHVLANIPSGHYANRIQVLQNILAFAPNVSDTFIASLEKKHIAFDEQLLRYGVTLFLKLLAEKATGYR